MSPHPSSPGEVSPRVIASDRAQLQIGIVGLDSSHCVEFARRLNDPAHPNHVPGGRITCAVRTWSADMPLSATRVEAFTQEMVELHQIRLVERVEDLLGQCDGILLCALDGRPRLQQFRAVAGAGLPVFVDKPVAASFDDVKSLFELAASTKTSIFSSSAMRWLESVREVKERDVGNVAGAFSYGPSPRDPHHPDLYFYGIHAVEALCTVLGPGCESVQRVTTERSSVIMGRWADGRTGAVQALHHWPASYGLTKMGDSAVFHKEIFPHAATPEYTPLLRVIMEFIQTHNPPVSVAETLEIYAFMEAAERSKLQHGASVTLGSVQG